jgi:hypothetical protein
VKLETRMDEQPSCPAGLGPDHHTGDRRCMIDRS